MLRAISDQDLLTYWAAVRSVMDVGREPNPTRLCTVLIGGRACLSVSRVKVPVMGSYGGGPENGH